MDHPITELVRYSSPHCICLFQKQFYQVLETGLKPVLFELLSRFSPKYYFLLNMAANISPKLCFRSKDHLEKLEPEEREKNLPKKRQFFSRNFSEVVLNDGKQLPSFSCLHHKIYKVCSREPGFWGYALLSNKPDLGLNMCRNCLFISMLQFMQHN